jgi:hypothetical protein
VDLSGRFRVTGWENAWDIIKGVLILIVYGILRKAYNSPKLLLRVARVALKVAKLTLIKSVGLSIVFLSSVMLAVLPIASYLFVQAGLNVPAQIVPLTIATTIALLLYGFIGLVGLGTGLWIVAPKHSVGKFGRNLVVVHIFRRRKGKARTGHNFLTSTCFGLIHRLKPNFP